MRTTIQVRGARENNLQNVDVEIPRDKLVVVTGMSGSGKSSTTLAGLVNGLDSAGDDYVLVDPGPPVVAHAVFTVLKQDRPGLRRAGVPLGTIKTRLELGVRKIATRLKDFLSESPLHAVS